MNKPVLFILLTMLLAFSCQRKISIFSSREEVINEFDFENLTAKARIKYDDGQRNLTGIANIRAKKDSAIWISLSPGLGVEAARLLIMRDSIFFMDRINNKYLKADYIELSKIYAFELNYEIMESVIIGNLIVPFRRSDLIEEENGLSYTRVEENLEIINFIGYESKKLEKLAVADLENESSISVNYGDFKALGEDAIFPYNVYAIVEYSASQKNRTKIDITYSRAEMPSQTPKFPFNVPNKYRSY